MAVILVETTKEEQERVLHVIRSIDSTKAVSVAKIAEKAGLSASRVRYAIADLLAANRIVRIPIKAYNKSYVRYSYKELKND